MSATQRQLSLPSPSPPFLSLSLALSFSSQLTVEQILTERDIAPNACLFISMPVTDGSSAGGSFTRGGATRGDTWRHTQCIHAPIYIGSDMYIQPRALPRGCLTIAIDDDLALVMPRCPLSFFLSFFFDEQGNMVLEMDYFRPGSYYCS